MTTAYPLSWPDGRPRCARHGGGEVTFRSIPYVWAAFLAIAAGLLLADWMGLVCISLLRDAH